MDKSPKKKTRKYKVLVGMRSPGLTLHSGRIVELDEDTAAKYLLNRTIAPYKGENAMREMR